MGKTSTDSNTIRIWASGPELRGKTLKLRTCVPSGLSVCPLLCQHGLEVSDVTFRRIVRAQNYHQIIMTVSSQTYIKFVPAAPVERCFCQDQTYIQMWCGEGSRVSLWRLVFSSSKPMEWWRALGRESLNSLVFIKLGINIMAMGPAKTTERAELEEKQFISSSFFTMSLGGWLCSVQSI